MFVKAVCDYRLRRMTHTVELIQYLEHRAIGTDEECTLKLVSRNYTSDANSSMLMPSRFDAPEAFTERENREM